MQNLYEIKSDRMITKLENIIKETQNHIEDCEVTFLICLLQLIKLLNRTALKEESDVLFVILKL